MSGRTSSGASLSSSGERSAGLRRRMACGQLVQRLDAAREPEPHEQQRDRHDQELRGEHVADDLAREAAALADGLGDLHEHRARHAGHLRADVRDAQLVVREGGRRGSTPSAARARAVNSTSGIVASPLDDVVPLVADLEKGLVVLVGAQDRGVRGRGLDHELARCRRSSCLEIATTLSRSSRSYALLAIVVGEEVLDRHADRPQDQQRRERPVDDLAEDRLLPMLSLRTFAAFSRQ